MREYIYVVEKDEAGWLVGSVPSLPGCFTQARTSAELHERMKEAIELYLETTSETTETTFVTVEKIAV